MGKGSRGFSFPLLPQDMLCNGNPTFLAISCLCEMERIGLSAQLSSGDFMSSG
jgi:hypothetical protein